METTQIHIIVYLNARQDSVQIGIIDRAAIRPPVILLSPSSQSRCSFTFVFFLGEKNKKIIYQKFLSIKFKFLGEKRRNFENVDVQKF